MAREPYYIRDDSDVAKVIAAIDRLANRNAVAPGPVILQASEDGVLERAGVRHVVFRAETVQLLFSIACGHPEFYTQCCRIGRTAAKDLWKCLGTLDSKRVVLPETLDRLVQVWSGWDRSGGWGRFAMTSVAGAAGGPAEYRARIDRNFLCPEGDSAAVYPHEAIQGFWRGYIEGFLNAAIVHAYQLIYEVAPPERAFAELSKYNTVCEIGLDREDDSALTTEQFRVVMIPDPMLPLWDHLGNAHQAKLRRDHARCVFRCTQALAWAGKHESTSLAFKEIAEDEDDRCPLGDECHDCIRRLMDGTGRDDERFAQLAYTSVRRLAKLLHERPRKTAS